MIVLGIETSCDETSAGIVDAYGAVLANVVATQVDVHARYGGIVPEIASRQHVIDIRPVVQATLAGAEIGWSDLDAIAVTHGPGLAGSLIIGLNMAKGLSASTGVPLVGVNHLEGHIYAAWASIDRASDHGDGSLLDESFAAGKGVMCLLVSGGHTELVLMRSENRFQLIGETRDDAAGEAFDKVARVLGLRYPGGPEIQRVAASSAATDPHIEPLSRAWMKGTHDFSFSGIKTAALNRAKKDGIYPPPAAPVTEDAVAPLARAFQDSVVDVLVTKTLAAAVEFECGAIIVAGGVAANGPLRDAFKNRSELPVVIPPISLCTDNGAMIAMAGLKRFTGGRRDGWGLDVEPGLRIGESESR